MSSKNNLFPVMVWVEIFSIFSIFNELFFLIVLGRANLNIDSLTFAEQTFFYNFIYLIFHVPMLTSCVLLRVYHYNL